ncbi:MAG TPA: HEPN domain-containing protein [Methanocorpusculum sp.]|nr:HEPN domain-containing protein [Methanocorpusculum sp.]
MTAHTSLELSRYRLNTAAECLSSAEMLINNDDCKFAANRAYYAVYHSMRAVLALDEFDSSRHSGIIAEFRKRYVKTGIFPVAMSDTISKLFDVRNKSDYEDFYVASPETVSELIEEARDFVNHVQMYLNSSR